MKIREIINKIMELFDSEENLSLSEGYLHKYINGSKTQVYLPTTIAPPLPNKWVI